MSNENNLLKSIIYCSLFLIFIGILYKFVSNGYHLSIFTKTKITCTVDKKIVDVKKVTGDRGTIFCSSGKIKYKILTYDMEEFNKYMVDGVYTFRVIHKRSKANHVYILSK